MQKLCSNNNSSIYKLLSYSKMIEQLSVIKTQVIRKPLKQTSLINANNEKSDKK